MRALMILPWSRHGSAFLSWGDISHSISLPIGLIPLTNSTSIFYPKKRKSSTKWGPKNSYKWSCGAPISRGISPQLSICKAIYRRFNSIILHLLPTLHNSPASIYMTLTIVTDGAIPVPCEHIRLHAKLKYFTPIKPWNSMILFTRWDGYPLLVTKNIIP